MHHGETSLQMLTSPKQSQLSPTSRRSLGFSSTETCSHRIKGRISARPTANLVMRNGNRPWHTLVDDETLFLRRISNHVRVIAVSC